MSWRAANQIDYLSYRRNGPMDVEAQSIGGCSTSIQEKRCFSATHGYLCKAYTQKWEFYGSIFFVFGIFFPWFWVVILREVWLKWRIRCFKDEFGCFPRGWGHLQEICNICSKGKHFFSTDKKFAFSYTNSRSRARDMNERNEKNISFTNRKSVHERKTQFLLLSFIQVERF